MKICLDAGHGGYDVGGQSLGKLEKFLVLEVQQKLWKALADLGHSCFPTRVEDTFISISSRAAYANRLGVDCFVSLHGNASSNPTARGAWTLHAAVSQSGKKLAESVQTLIGDPSKALPDKSSWVSGRRLGVLWQTRAPAILVELGFMTSPEDIKVLQNPAEQRLLAQKIAYGIDAWRP